MRASLNMMIPLLLVWHLTAPSAAATATEEEEEQQQTAGNNDSAAPSSNDNNCFSLVNPDSWSLFLRHNTSSAELSVDVSRANPSVLDCLQGQQDNATTYRLDLMRSSRSGAEHRHSSRQVSPESLLSGDLEFEGLTPPGSYRVRFHLCLEDCEAEGVTSDPLAQVILPECERVIARNWHHNSSNSHVTFGVNLPNCTSAASVALFSSFNATLACSEGQFVSDKWVEVDDEGLLVYKSAELEGDAFYCLSVSCHCLAESAWVYVESLPPIARILPFCSSHFSCAWLYLTVAGCVGLILSCLLSVCLLKCCCCCRRDKKKRRRLSREDAIPFEGISVVNDCCPPKKTWAELHEEWDVEPPKNPGKILLLYSPDSTAFKQLQTAFKGFLELACHCVVLDLFDEELFQSIAFDPEMWLSNLLQDDDFKIIVICSEGAYKRQEALLKGEVLNIPDNSSMDGLFSAGLKFIQSQHAYDYNRLALARYERLRLSAPEFRLEEMVPNREFLVPAQLHELFCWIHGYDPADLLGKPWERFHLEWQLLTDELRKARLERR